jgi:hypothetical protein
MALTPGASLIREGRGQELLPDSAIRAADSISTDATGRVKILFDDDSIVSLGGNTTIEIRDYVDVGRDQRFEGHVLQGLGRFITGRIVEANPAGFKVSTPEALVGIRGTIISVRTMDGLTTVYVENTTRNVFVNGLDIPSGNKITVPDDPARVEPITPSDRRELGTSLAFRGGAGVAAAAPEPSPDTETHEEPLLFGTSGSLVPPDSPLGDIALANQGLGDLLVASAGGGSGGGLIARYEINNVTIFSPAFSMLSFGFSVNLGTATIFDGIIVGNGLNSGVFTLYGGTGVVSGAEYWIQGFSGSSHVPGNTGIWIPNTFVGGDASVMVNSLIVTVSIPDSLSGYSLARTY